MAATDKTTFVDTTQPAPVKKGSTRYSPLFQKYGNMFKVPPGLVAGVAGAESGYNPNAMAQGSSAAGMMQITQPTWNTVAPGLNLGHPLDRMNPEDNIAVGSAYLGQLLQRAGGNQAMAAAMYNQGPNASPQNLASANANYWPEVQKFMAAYNPDQPQGGMFQGDPNQLLQHIDQATSDPTDPANKPPSVTDPIRIAGDSAGILSGYDPRMVAQFSAALAQQMLQQEQQYRLTRSQQLMVLAQTFAPYGQDRAPELFAQFQQQNAQRAAQAQTTATNIASHMAEADYVQRARTEAQAQKIYAGLEQQEMKLGTYQGPITDQRSAEESKQRIAAAQRGRESDRNSLQQRGMELRQRMADLATRKFDAMEKRYGASKLANSPAYWSLKQDYNAILNRITHLTNAMNDKTRADWLDQMPGWQQELDALDQQRSQIEMRLNAALPEESGTTGSQAAPQNEPSEPGVSNDDADRALKEFSDSLKNALGPGK